MRLVWFAVVALAVAVGTVAAIPHVAEGYVIALVLAPIALCMVCGWVLMLQNRGLRVSRGWKEVLIFGPLQAQPDNWGHQISRVPALVLLYSIAIAVGALIGTLWTSLV